MHQTIKNTVRSRWRFQKLANHFVGAQRADVGSIRAIWVQDKLALNAEEERVIELKRDVISGQERVV